MKMGMSKGEARARIESGEYVWEDIKQILKDVHPTLAGKKGNVPSRVNGSASLATAFNTYWRAIVNTSGAIAKPGEQRTAINILQEFGAEKAEQEKERQDKEKKKLAHEELIDIAE